MGDECSTTRTVINYQAPLSADLICKQADDSQQAGLQLILMFSSYTSAQTWCLPNFNTQKCVHGKRVHFHKNTLSLHQTELSLTHTGTSALQVEMNYKCMPTNNSSLFTVRSPPPSAPTQSLHFLTCPVLLICLCLLSFVPSSSSSAPAKCASVSESGLTHAERLWIHILVPDKKLCYIFIIFCFVLSPPPPPPYSSQRADR